MFVTLQKEHETLKTSNYFTVAFAEANIKGETKEIVVKRAISNEAYTRWKQERDILSDISNPGIVKLYGSDIQKKELYLEKINGKSLFEYCCSNYFTLFESLYVMQGITSTLSYLHSNIPGKPSIIHGDISLSNILLDENMNPRFIDFENSFYVNKIPEFHKTIVSGTPICIAPEKFDGDIFSTEKSDVYGTGINFYFLLDNKYPYNFPDIQSMNPIDRMDAVQKIVDKKKPRKLSTPDPKINSLIMSMIDKNPNNRPTSREVYNALFSII